MFRNQSGRGGPNLPPASANAGRAHGNLLWLHQYSDDGIVPRESKRETLNPSSISLYQSTRSSIRATTQNPPPRSPHGDNCHFSGGIAAAAKKALCSLVASTRSFAMSFRSES